MARLGPRRIIVVLAAAGLVATASPALAAPPPPPPPAWAATATTATHLLNAVGLGPAPAATAIPVTVSLAPRHGAALDALAAAQADPASTGYHHYLTPAQFTARFGATPAQVHAVTSYLRSTGFHDVTVGANRLSVSADGTAAAATRAFHTHLGLFRQAGRSVVANTGPALVPIALSGLVDAVVGLNTAAAARPLVSAPRALAPSGFTPPQLARAYDATSLPPASGNTMAVLAEGNLTQTVTDLRTAEARNGEPQVPVRIVKTGPASNDTSGTIEWDLDSQASTAMAGNVKTLVFYDAPSLNDPDIVKEFQAFAAGGVPTGSASFGECDSQAAADGTTTAVDTALRQAMVQGQTMFASSGDTGSGCSSFGGVLGSLLPAPTETSFPASGTFTTAVGGTTLDAPGGAYGSETAWSGSGGGFSTQPAPPYQANADRSVAGSGSGGGCLVLCGLLGNLGLPLSVPGLDPAAATSGRGVPDIAFDADPNTGANIIVNGQAETVGGTSLASPLALGAWTRLQAAHANLLGNAGPRLYALYNRANPAGKAGHATPGLHDVTSGTNGAFDAKPGYDLVTGLGSFDVAALNRKL